MSAREPLMAEYGFSIHVDAPRQRVFALWTDLDRMREWVGGVTRVTDVTGPVEQAGTRYTVWFGPMRSPTEVLEVESPGCESARRAVRATTHDRRRAGQIEEALQRWNAGVGWRRDFVRPGHAAVRQTESGCLALADISGYTSYLAGAELDHAQDVLEDLTDTVVRALSPPMRLRKLEGDAVFVYMPGNRVDAAMLLLASPSTRRTAPDSANGSPSRWRRG